MIVVSPRLYIQYLAFQVFYSQLISLSVVYTLNHRSTLRGLFESDNDPDNPATWRGDKRSLGQTVPSVRAVVSNRDIIRSFAEESDVALPKSPILKHSSAMGRSKSTPKPFALPGASFSPTVSMPALFKHHGRSRTVSQDRRPVIDTVIVKQEDIEIEESFIDRVEFVTVPVEFEKEFGKVSTSPIAPSGPRLPRVSFHLDKDEDRRSSVSTDTTKNEEGR